MDIFKIGIKFLLASFVQIIVVIICYDFYAVYRLKNTGSASLSAMENVNPIIWNVIIIEVIISVVLIAYGLVLHFRPKAQTKSN